MDSSQFTALLQVLGRIADALERSQMSPEQVGQYIQAIDQQNLRYAAFMDEFVSVKYALQGIREELSNTGEQLSSLNATVAMALSDVEGVPYLQTIATDLGAVGLHLAGIQNAASELNTHPGFEAIQNIASSLDSIRRLGIPVEQG